MNNSNKEIVSVDIPSGVSADSGKIMGVSVKATITVTFQYAKYGHFLYPGKEMCGKLFVEDISVYNYENNKEKVAREAIIKNEIILKKRRHTTKSSIKTINARIFKGQ
jgi:NAD(P)H-hydrate epimerase